MRTRLSGVSAWTVVLSTGVAALATVVFQVLGSLNLRVAATILATVAVAALGWLAQRAKSANDKRQSWLSRTSAIEDALAVWPLCRVQDAGDRAFDTGLYPSASDASRTADPDPDLDPQLKPGEILLFVGPAGCGKSHRALKLLRDQLPDAWLIVPDGARGLASLLSLDPPFGISPGQPAVMLLDGCKRFLPGLRLGALDELRTRCKDLYVVATIRDDEIDALLHSPTGTGYLARRLVARARVVPVARGAFGGAGASASTGAASSWSHAQEPLIGTPGGDPAGPDEQAPLLPSAPRSVLGDWGVRGLVTVALAALGGFAAVGLFEGIIQPAPVTAQLTALIDHQDACGQHSVYAPPSTDAISSDQPVVVVTHDAGSCHSGRQSDDVSLFVPVAGRLTEVYSFQPNDADGGAYEFRCSGTMPGDPCLTNVGGTSAYAATGAFTNTNTLASYPIEIESTGDGFRAAPLVPPTGGVPTTTLGDGASSVTVASANAYTVVQPLAGQPPVFVIGQISAGTFDWPITLRLFAWSASAGASPSAFDHECRPLASGQTLHVSFVRPSGDFVADLGALLARYWTRVALRDGESCP
jgi:hypothetical protein